jgi:8-oxo-dGTP pyrophosphatase MutT (NUDIX family)
MAIGRFQVAAGAVIKNKDTQKVLLIHRSASQYAGDIWEIPIGRMEQFETFEAGLRREASEETGLTQLEVGKPFSVFEFMRGEAAAENEVRAVVFAVQTQQDKIQLSDEHDDFRWLPIDEAIELVTHPGIKHELTLFKEMSAQTTA